MSRKRLISPMYVMSDLKTLMILFSTKSSMTYNFCIVYLTNLPYQFFHKRNIYQDFCNHTGQFKFSAVHYVPFGMTDFN